MKNLLLGLLALVTLSACASPQKSPDGLTQGQLLRMADQQGICVDNGRDYAGRVLIVDARHGTQYGTVWLRPFKEECEWVDVPAGAPVHAVIDAVGFPRKVTPPAWRHLMTEPGTVMHLHLGLDGVTPFSHSGRTGR